MPRERRQPADMAGQAEPHSTECLYDLTRGELVGSPSASVRQFWARITELQEEGKKRRIEESITLLLINRGYSSDDRALAHYVWGTIPWGEFDRVMEFVRNNAARAYQIIWGDDPINTGADSSRSLRDTVAKIGEIPRTVRIPEAFQ